MRSLVMVFGLALLVALAGFARTPQAAARNPNAVAVIIGNKTYQDRVPPVQFAHRDADAMRRYVVDVLGFHPDNIIGMRDATKSRLEEAFGSAQTHKGRLWSYLDPDGASDIVVYFSGHGVPGQKDARGYLLPSDASPDFAELNGYPIDLLFTNLARLKARSITVFLEACFSGDSHAGMLIRSANPVYLQAKMPKDREITVLTAASGKQLASWDEQAGHGLFTHHLLDALYGQADRDGNGRVTLAETRAYLKRHMTRGARRTYLREQIATVHGPDAAILAAFNPASAPARPMVAGLPAAPAPAAPAAPTSPAAPAPPAAAVALEPIDAQYITTKNANVRDQPSVRGSLVATVPRGTAVATLGKVKGADWYAVELKDGRRGYVYRTLLAEAAVPPRPAGPSPATPAVGVFSKSYRPGDSFRDCSDCPEMVVVPAGSFMMGSPEDEADRDDDEGPQHRVRIGEAFAVGKYEITRGQWASFVTETGRDMGSSCWIYDGENWKNEQGRNWRNTGFEQTASHPVVCVSWEDAKAYVAWLSVKTGETYRLLSEAEWEFAARAGSTGAYPFDSEASAQCIYANGADSSTSVNWRHKACSDGYLQTAPVGRFRANRFGLHDMIGNVWEWVEDCRNKTYDGAPVDGSAWTGGDCSINILRGGSWNYDRGNMRSATRNQNNTDHRDDDSGFRVARALR